MPLCIFQTSELPLVWAPAEQRPGAQRGLLPGLWAVALWAAIKQLCFNPGPVCGIRGGKRQRTFLCIWKWKLSKLACKAWVCLVLTKNLNHTQVIISVGVLCLIKVNKLRKLATMILFLRQNWSLQSFLKTTQVNDK